MIYQNYSLRVNYSIISLNWGPVYYGIATFLFLANGGFSRVCLPAVSNHTDGCEVTLSGSNNCYCNSDRCNSQAFYYGLGSRTCYVCTSVDFMDNGCGANLNTKSVYVQQQSGCTACGKTIAASPGKLWNDRKYFGIMINTRFVLILVIIEKN